MPNTFQDSMILSLMGLLEQVISQNSEDLPQLSATHFKPVLNIDYSQIETELLNKVITPVSVEQIAKSATIIQRFWRKNKVKQQLRENSYETYVSLLSSESQDDNLSAKMFGKYQAQPGKSAINYINNPLITSDDNYHRIDSDISQSILNALINNFYPQQVEKNDNEVIIPGTFFARVKKFINKNKTPNNVKQNTLETSSRNIHFFNTDEFDYFPVSLVKISPIESLIQEYIDDYNLEIISTPEHNIGFIKIPISNEQDYAHSVKEVKSYLSALGLKASPWAIALNIANIPIRNQLPHSITLNPNLPTTLNTLYGSKIYNNLIKISVSNYSCKYLAQSLRQLLENPPPLNSNSIIRIALMLDLANTFYKQNYAKYTFYVYAIVHEISLALIKDSSINIDRLFDDFQNTIKQSIFKILNITSSAIELGAFPALSGSHAHTIGYELAKKLCRVKRQLTVVEPNYYEFEEIRTESSLNGEIFAITTGPLVSPSGIHPGTDINKFIHQNIPKDQHSILLIDTTTTLYKNLSLSEEALELINNNLLTIIINESHQKFGLLHTDQAQYGQMYVIYKNDINSHEIISDAINKVREDFHNHPDLRIGAYISTRCADILEKIKTRHFRNGAILKNLLPITQYMANDNKQYHLRNLDELYFYVPSSHPLKICNAYFLKTALTKILPDRPSFGHSITSFSYVEQLIRVSPDASDLIEILLLAAEIYIYYFSQLNETDIVSEITLFNRLPNKLIDLFFGLKDISNQLNLREQIIALAIGNRIVQSLPNILSKDYKEENYLDITNIHDTLSTILNSCDLLIGREAYSNIKTRYLELHKLLQSFKNSEFQEQTIESMPKSTSKSTSNEVNEASENTPEDPDQIETQIFKHK